MKIQNKIKIESIFIVITILFSLFGFILILNNGNITGFAEFSIYPIEQTTQQSSKEQFGILPIENLSTQIEQETQFKIQPNETIQLGIMAAPVVDAVILNSTDPTLNNTNQNLTCWNTTSDADSDPVKTIVNWWHNTSSAGDMVPLMVLNMPFEANKTGENTTDYSGYGHHGTSTGATYSQTAGYDNWGAYEFCKAGACDDYIDLTTHVSTLDDYSNGTISLWFKSSATSTNTLLFGISDKDTSNDLLQIGVCNGWSGAVASESLIYSHYQGGSAKIDAFVCKGDGYYNDGLWHHYAFVMGSDFNKVYVDGTEETMTYVTGGSTTGNYFLNVPNADFSAIGVRQLSGSKALYFNGTIDELRIYDKPFSAEQIKFLYENKSWMINSDETDDNEHWKCQVYPNDATEDGAPVNSSILKIEPNQAPTIGSVILNSTDPTLNDTNQNLTCWNLSVSDAEGDPIKTIFNWYKDNSSTMVLNMPFEENGSASTTPKDYSPYGNDGAITGTVTYTSSGGVDGFGAYDFDGSGDYIKIVNNAVLEPAELTACLWFNNDAETKPYPYILHMGDWGGATPCGYAITLIDNDDIRGGVITDTNEFEIASYVASLETGVWYHACITYKDPNLILYLNGVNVSSNTDGGAMDYTCGTNSLTIGCATHDPTNADACVDGKIDEVRIYNRSLSAEQINLLYQNKSWMIHSDETSTNEHWKCQVTPNDGTEDGSSTNSSELEILNNAPTISPIYIYSDDDTKNTTIVNLTGIFSVSDTDGDSMTANETTWYNNSLEVSYLRNSTNVWYPNTSKGEDWMFSARTYDSTDWSTWTNSSNFTILNTAPTISSVILNSTDPTLNNTNQNLTCWNTTSDADSDSVKTIVNWYKDNSSIMVLNIPFEANKTGHNTTDYSGHNVAGAVTSATWSATGGYDGFGAYSFDGNDDHIQITDDTSLRPSTISGFAWINKDSNAGRNTIFACGNVNAYATNNYILEANGDTDIRVLGRTNAKIVTASNNITAGAWYHVGFTNNGSDTTIYVNGVARITDTQNIGTDDTTGFDIGQGLGTGTDLHFKGKIDEIRIYNYTLSANQIQLLYQNKSWMIHSDETSSNEHWKCQIYPNDRTEDGSSVNSSELEILNAAPTIDKPSILPYPAYTNSTLNCSTTIYDIDLADTLNVNFSWYNGTNLEYSTKKISLSNGSFTSDILTAQLQDKTQTWNCTVTPNDGTIDGSPQSNTTKINNTKPQVDLVFPANDTSSENRNTTFYYNVTDIDNLIHNCSLWISDEDSINLEYNQTNSSEINLGNNNTFNIKNLTVGYHLWLVSCEDDEAAETNSSTRYYTTSNDYPIINLKSPDNKSTSTSSSVTFTYNVSDQDTITNCSIIIDNTIDQTDTTITKETDQTFTKTFSTNDDYTWSINCTDDLNYKNNSITRTLTINAGVAKAPPPSGFSSDSGAGSSGGTQSYISEIEQTESSITYTIPSLITPITIKPQQTMYVTSITINPARETSNVKITIEELNNLQIKKPKDVDIIKFIKATTENLNSVLYKSIIKFRVPKSEINNKIELHYYYEGKWIKTQTNFIEEDDDFKYYESTSPLLSYFVITTEKKQTFLTYFTSKVKTFIKENIQKLKEKSGEKLIINTFFLLVIAIILVIILIKTFMGFIKLKIEYLE